MKIIKAKVILLLPIPVFLISLCLGDYSIPVKEVVDIILYKIIGYTMFSKTLNAKTINVLIYVRMPRVVLSMLVGMALSVSGASFQAILRNPLVDPYILGVSAGAAFGAALAMFFVNISVQISAFIFALISVGICYSIANYNREIYTIRLILSGVVISSVFTALLSMLQILVDPLKLQGMVYWIMGSFHTANWDKVLSVMPYMLIGTISIYILRWKLNILSFGEEDAKVLGLNTNRTRKLIIIASTLLASSAVSVSGIISLVGLMIPHIVRMMFGPDNRKIIPLTICLGASYLTVVDNISRTLMNYEIPIGIFTTLLGAPFFIYLLRRTKAGGWN